MQKRNARVPGLVWSIHRNHFFVQLFKLSPNFYLYLKRVIFKPLFGFILISDSQKLWPRSSQSQSRSKFRYRC